MTKQRRITAARGFLRSTRAVSALEYAILVGVIAVGATAALTTFGNNIKKALEDIGSQVADTVDEVLEEDEGGG